MWSVENITEGGDFYVADLYRDGEFVGSVANKAATEHLLAVMNAPSLDPAKLAHVSEVKE